MQVYTVSSSLLLNSAVHTLLVETTLKIALETALAAVCESVGKGDGHSGEQKNTQRAGPPLVVVGDGATAADR